MYGLHKPGYDPETMRAVALAYRRERKADQLDGPRIDRRMALLQLCSGGADLPPGTQGGSPRPITRTDVGPLKEHLCRLR